MTAQISYQLTLTGTNPLLMHKDNMGFQEVVAAWRLNPANKGLSVAGDDRSPACTWLGSVYSQWSGGAPTKDAAICMDADNIKTVFREGGKLLRKGARGNFQKDTQSGIYMPSQYWRLYGGNGEEINFDQMYDRLVDVVDFNTHLKAAEDAGFELLVKRARIGKAKHVRVRPMFRTWTITGEFIVIDEDQSGLTEPVLRMLVATAGAKIGLGDWRPSSATPGSFGTFIPELVRLS